MKKNDLILIALVLIAAGVIFCFYSAGAKAGLGVEVTVDGESKAFLPLDADDTLRIDTEWGYNIVTVADGKAFVSEADCRDGICVEHKKIEKVGETIVCLPHKLVVEIVGEAPASFDTVMVMLP